MGKTPIVRYPTRGQATRDLRYAVKLTVTTLSPYTLSSPPMPFGQQRVGYSLY